MAKINEKRLESIIRKSINEAFGGYNSLYSSYIEDLEDIKDDLSGCLYGLSVRAEAAAAIKYIDKAIEVLSGIS